MLSAVFAPMVFFPGSTGVIYRQFSVTVIASMLLSVVVALILTPVLCASLLKPVEAGHEAAETGFRLLRPFFVWFDRWFFRMRDGYVGAVDAILGRKKRFVAAFVVLLAVGGFLYWRMPTGYLPDEDQGSILAMVQLPVGATLEQTEAVMEEARGYFLGKEKDAVENCMSVAGFGFAGRGQNQGLMWIQLKDWDLRNRPDLRAAQLANRATRALSGVRQAIIFVFPPPAVTELGTATGFDVMLQDRGGLGHQALMDARNQLLGMAAKDPRLARVRPNGMSDVAQYKVDVDWDKAGALGVPVSTVQRYLSTAFGSSYVGNFIQGGRVKHVYAQADAPFRMLPTDLDRLYVRNVKDGLVPFSALATGRWVYGSPRLERYNAMPAMDIQGEPSPGHSTGEAMKAMEELIGQAPPRRRVRVDRTLLPAAHVRVAGRAALHLLHPCHLPGARRPLRELDLPHYRAAGPAARGHRRRPRLLDPRPAQRRLLPDRAAHRARPHHEERDPDRPVRDAEHGPGDGAHGGHRAGRQASPPPHRHDVAGLRLRRVAAGARSRGWRRGQKAIGTSVLGGMITATFLAIFFIPLFFVLVARTFGRKRSTPRLVADASPEAALTKTGDVR